MLYGRTNRKLKSFFEVQKKIAKDFDKIDVNLLSLDFTTFNKGSNEIFNTIFTFNGIYTTF